MVVIDLDIGSIIWNKIFKLFVLFSLVVLINVFGIVLKKLVYINIVYKLSIVGIIIFV